MTKRCPQCGLTKDESQYGRRKERKRDRNGALKSWCKACHNKANIDYNRRPAAKTAAKTARDRPQRRVIRRAYERKRRKEPRHKATWWSAAPAGLWP